MIAKLFCKLIGNQISSSSSSSSGTASAILGCIALLIILLGMFIWFYCACHGWLVLVWPSFAAFPRWAFVLLMFLFTSKSSGSSSS